MKEYLLDQYETEGKTMTNWFTIYDKTTGRELATLPLTLPIGATVEGFEKAGYQVGWRWSE
jgi:hypothetical protein